MSTKVFAPASVGNFLVGFDILGLAITTDELLGDIVAVEAADSLGYDQTGPYVSQLPEKAEDNLAFQALKLFQEAVMKQGIKAAPVHLTLEKRLPIGSGLGSSSSSIVAALVALNYYYKQPLQNNELLLLAGQLEGNTSGSIHYDNVAPCLLGSLQLMGDEHTNCQRIEPPAHWQYVLCYPGIRITTQEARSILPTQIKLSDAIDWNRRLSNLMLALARQDSDELIKPLLLDNWITPCRQHLIPHFLEAQMQMATAGMLAFGIAGAGPSMMAVCQTQRLAQQAVDIFKKLYGANANHFIHSCRIDNDGARLI